MSGNSEFLYFAIAMFGMVGLGLAIRRAGMTAIDAVVAGAIIGIATTLCVVVVADVNLEDEGVIVLAVFGGGGIATILAGYVLGALPWNKAPSA
jgi:hypothetical protein